jgi:hypothetical protein
MDKDYTEDGFLCELIRNIELTLTIQEMLIENNLTNSIYINKLNDLIEINKNTFNHGVARLIKHIKKYY